MAPNFHKQFKLYADASDIGMDAFLLQEDSVGVDHPVLLFKKGLTVTSVTIRLWRRRH